MLGVSLVGKLDSHAEAATPRRARPACHGRLRSDDTVDASKAEQGIESSSLSTSTTQITSASCPGDVKKEKGGTFTCDVKLSGGGKAEVTVTQTSNHNTFSYAFKSGSVVLPGSTVDKEVEQDLANAGIKDATVNCPATSREDRHHRHMPDHHLQRQAGNRELHLQRLSGTVDSSSVQGVAMPPAA